MIEVNVVVHLVMVLLAVVSIGALAWGFFPAATEWYAERLYDRLYVLVHYRALREERLERRRAMSRRRELAYFRGTDPEWRGLLAQELVTHQPEVLDLEAIRAMRTKLLRPFSPDEAA